jgi:sec-independent protein translocase protein TatA
VPPKAVGGVSMVMPGFPEMVLIFLAVVLLFGAKRLPGLGGAIGESIKNFKKGISEKKAIPSSQEEEKDKPSDS